MVSKILKAAIPVSLVFASALAMADDPPAAPASAPAPRVPRANNPK